MFKNNLFACMTILCLLLSPAVFAQTDDSLEEQALEIAEKLACVVCSDMHIEQATDETAEDIRFFIRRQLRDGKNTDAVMHLVLTNYENVVVKRTSEQIPPENPELIALASALLFFGAMLFYLFRRTRFVIPAVDRKDIGGRVR